MTADLTTAVPRGRWAAIRDGVGAGVGVVLGLVPHVLHHAGLLVGTALVTGAGGNALFFLIGLLFSLPMLRRLYRRFHTWKAPAIATGVFVALFSLSAFVIGPTLTTEPSPGDAPTQPSETPTEEHTQHHSP
jgi:hypothetical protein